MNTTKCGHRLPRFGWALFVGVSLALVVGGRLSSQPDQGPKGDLPEGLRHVPADAMAFMHLRLGDILKTDLGKMLKDHVTRNEGFIKHIREAERLTGVNVADVESVTLIVLEPPPDFDRWHGERMDIRRSDVPAPSSRGPVFEPQGKPIFPKEDFFPKKDLPKFETPKADPPAAPQIKPDGPPALDADLESAVALQQEFVFPEPSRSRMEYMFGPLVVLTTTKPYDRKKLLKTFVMPARDGDDAEAHRPRDVSVLFLSDRSFMVGAPHALIRYADQGGQPRPVGPGPGPGLGGPKGGIGGFGKGKGPALGKGMPGGETAAPLRMALNMGREPHLLVAGAHLPASFKQRMMFMRPDDCPGALATLYPLLNVSSAGLALSLDKTADLRVQLQGTNPRSTALAAEAAKAGLALVDLGFDHLLAQAKADGEEDPKAAKRRADLLQKARKALGAMTVEQEGNVVQVRLRTDVDPTTLAMAVGEVILQVQKAGEGGTRANNLKHIGIAMHNYHDVYKGLPPQALTSIKNQDGKPLLSWRVAILPFIEQENVYRQFNLDEPWDSPHNKKLIAQMPPIYMVPGAKKTREPGMTHYQVFVGPGTAFERIQGQTRIGMRLPSITDGTSNTLMVVEAANPVIWTKPDDVPFDPQQPLPKLGVFGDGFYALFCDGHVQFIRRNVPQETLRALITRNGGEPVQLP